MICFAGFCLHFSDLGGKAAAHNAFAGINKIVLNEVELNTSILIISPTLLTDV